MNRGWAGGAQRFSLWQVSESAGFWTWQSCPVLMWAPGPTLKNFSWVLGPFCAWPAESLPGENSSAFMWLFQLYSHHGNHVRKANQSAWDWDLREQLLITATHVFITPEVIQKFLILRSVSSQYWFSMQSESLALFSDSPTFSYRPTKVN